MRTWIVQSNLDNSRELRAISAACAKIGARCLPMEAIPFDDSPLRLPSDLDPKAVIAYGAVGFVQRVHRQLGPAASLYDPESFNTRTYRRRWGSNVLNQPWYSGPLLWLARGQLGVPESLGDEHGTDVECVVLDVRSYLSVKYPTDAERLLPDDQVVCGSTKILCGHMTSDEPTIIIVSAAGENDSIRLLACQPATPGSTTYTADSRKEPTT